MKARNIIQTAIVIVVGIVAVGVFVASHVDEPRAIADDKPEANELKNTKTPDADFSPYVDKEGKITLPKGYKQKWSHLGSWAVAKKPGETIHELHGVYTQPETIVAFNKTGKFPDGAVLVKEVRETNADRLTTGHSAWSTDMKIWFVMIKDSKERFKDNDHWGDGWGWAFFKPGNTTKTVSTDYKADCLGCHEPVRDSDLIYSYAYPVLQR